MTSSADAHAAHGEATGFIIGVGHPWSGLDHILAMLAVGLWGAQLGAPAIWLLPVVFPMVMSIGAFLGLIGIPIPNVEIGIALSAVVLGVMVSAEAKPTLVVAASLVGAFAIFHGHAHGTELPEGQSGLLYSIGFVIGTGLLHALGIGIGLIHKWSAGAVVIRAVGGTHRDWRSLFSLEGLGMIRLTLPIATLLLAASPTVAYAHLVTTGLGPVYDGIGHLLVTPEDLLAVLALCLFSGLRGTAASRRVLFLLPVVWFAAGHLIGFHGNLFGEFPFAAVTLILLGVLVAADVRVSPAAVAVIAIAIGIVHGWDNGAALKESTGWKGLLGISAGIFVIVSVMTAVVVTLRIPWMRIVVRVVGSWIVATGILMLGWHFRPHASRIGPSSHDMRVVALAPGHEGTSLAFPQLVLHAARRSKSPRASFGRVRCATTRLPRAAEPHAT